ncbi:MAG: histone deacetylase [Bacteroidia bacterium]
MLKIAFSELYAHTLPEGHRFPMLKYELIPEQLLYEGTIQRDNLFVPKPLSEEILLWTHCENYWAKLKNLTLTDKEIRKTGFPLSARLVQREAHILQGTLDAALFAQKHGVAMNIAGGTHHAFRDSGEGFCLLNDFAVASTYLIKKGLAKQILIVDLDVHQGNGSAKIFENEDKVFTFSMHCGANYPLHKEKSDLDIELPVGATDELFLSLLKTHLPRLIDEVQPDFICYLSGVDILHTDKLGRLACTLKGCKERDKYVLTLCKTHNIPVVIAMGGGYSVLIKDIVEAHCNTFRVAQELYF